MTNLQKTLTKDVLKYFQYFALINVIIASFSFTTLFIARKSKTRRKLDWNDEEQREILLQREGVRVMKSENAKKVFP